MKTLWQLAGVVAKSPAAIFVLLMTGVELGLTPMRALRSIYMVQGRPTPLA